MIVSAWFQRLFLALQAALLLASFAASMRPPGVTRRTSSAAEFLAIALASSSVSTLALPTTCTWRSASAGASARRTVFLRQRLRNLAHGVVQVLLLEAGGVEPVDVRLQERVACLLDLVLFVLRPLLHVLAVLLLEGLLEIGVDLAGGVLLFLELGLALLGGGLGGAPRHVYGQRLLGRGQTGGGQGEGEHDGSAGHDGLLWAWWGRANRRETVSFAKRM